MNNYSEYVVTDSGKMISHREYVNSVDRVLKRVFSFAGAGSTVKLRGMIWKLEVDHFNPLTNKPVPRWVEAPDLASLPYYQAWEEEQSEIVSWDNGRLGGR